MRYVDDKSPSGQDRQVVCEAHQDRLGGDDTGFDRSWAWYLSYDRSLHDTGCSGLPRDGHRQLRQGNDQFVCHAAGHTVSSTWPGLLCGDATIAAASGMAESKAMDSWRPFNHERIRYRDDYVANLRRIV